MLYRYTLILLITLSMACSGSDTEGEVETEDETTDLTAQQELCADYPENIQCPTLPAPPTLADGTDFTNWEPQECPLGHMAEFGQDNCISIGDPCRIHSNRVIGNSGCSFPKSFFTSSMD